MEDIRAVLDAAESEQALLFAVGDGGPLAILFTATYPERVLGLVLWHSWPRLTRAPDLPWLRSRGEIERRFEDMTARLDDRIALEESIGRQNPGLATERERREFARPIRLSLSPGGLATYLRTNLDVDVRDILRATRVPTLVIYVEASEVYDPRSSRYLADHIPGARLVQVPGADFAPVVGDWPSVVRELEGFAKQCVSGRREGVEPERVLATMLFTDIAGSTAKAAELGDRRWRELLAEHHAVVRRQLASFHGTELDTAGDGFLAMFDGPARAILCACATVEAVRQIGLDIRAGVHTGECERLDGEIGGIAVHIGARVAAEAQPGEVLASSTVKDLVAGSEIQFRERGLTELKGVPGEWRLFAVAAVPRAA